MTVSLLEAIQGVLDPLVAGGAFYLKNDTEPLATDGNGAALDYIVYTDVVSADTVDFEGATSTQSTHLQVDIFSPRGQQGQAIRKTVDAALAAAFVTVPLSTQGLFEDAARLFRVIREYSIWYDESDS